MMGKYNIEICLLPHEEEVLKGLHCESNELLSAGGGEEMSFEEWFGCMLRFCGISSIITTAQTANRNTRKRLSNKEELKCQN